MRFFRHTLTATLILLSANLQAQSWWDNLPKPGAGLPGGISLPGLPGLPGSNSGISEKTVQLMGFGAKPDGITVSGLSAGAFMAVQLHLAFSERVSGTGVIAGGVYYCAEGNQSKATGDCMKGGRSVTAQKSLNFANDFYNQGLIDNPENLKDDKVYLFSGTNDVLVNQYGMVQLEKMYEGLVDKKSIKTVFDTNAGHGVPTLDTGSACTSRSYFNAPWLLNCNYDAAGDIFETLYGKLKPAVNPVDENLFAFDQREFLPSSGISMSSTGHVYVPTSCQDGKTSCRVHVALHGCDQDPATVGTKFVTGAGYNSWAEANDIIVLYPAATKNFWNPQNPLGCFDWWGYTDSNYATKDGVQMKAIMSMIDRLAE